MSTMVVANKSRIVSTSPYITAIPCAVIFLVECANKVTLMSDRIKVPLLFRVFHRCVVWYSRVAMLHMDEMVETALPEDLESME